MNEAFLRAYPALGIGSAMKGIRQGSPNTEAEIVGVVKDFHYQDLSHPVEPYAFYCSGEQGSSTDASPRYFRVAVKAVEGRSGAVAGKLTGLLNKFSDGENNARCEVLNNTARALYSGNSREGSLVRISSILSLVLALLGIFGLIYMEVETLRKGVAVRRLLGASTPDLLWMLMRRYIILGTVVFAAAVPLSVWIFGLWREQFVEQAPIPSWVFILAWVLVMGATAAVISSMSLVIARTDPAVELKKE